MKRPALLALVALAACALAPAVIGGAPGNAATSKGPAAGKTVKIGVIADRTGSAAVYGVAQDNSYQLANEDLKSGLLDAGGAALTFDVEDAATDGSALILGPTLSGEARKGDPIAVRAGTAVVGTSTTADGITSLGPCVFRVSLSEAQVIPATIARTKSVWKYKTAALIYGDDNAFTKTDGDIFKAQLEKAGVTIVDTETFHIGDKDFAASLTKIKAAKPDVIVLGALAEEAEKIIQQAATLGIKTHMLGGNGLNSTKIYDYAGPAAAGVVVGAAWYINGNYTGNASFVARYKKKYGSNPDQFAAQAYAAAQLVTQLVRDGKATKDEMCPALHDLRVAQTVLGPIAFDPGRDVKAAPVILQIVKGGFAYFH